MSGLIRRAAGRGRGDHEASKRISANLNIIPAMLPGFIYISGNAFTCLRANLMSGFSYCSISVLKTLNISHCQSIKILVPPLVRNTGTSSVSSHRRRRRSADNGH
jgi:hypothetical protein